MKSPMMKKEMRSRGKIKKEWLWAYVFLAPMFLGTLVFGLFPILYSFFLSVTKWDLLSGFQGMAGIENFISVFTNPTTLYEIRNTLVYSAATVPITLMFSLLFANLLSKGIRGKGIFRIIYFLPNIIMPTAVAMVWRWLFYDRNETHQ